MSVTKIGFFEFNLIVDLGVILGNITKLGLSNWYRFSGWLIRMEKRRKSGYSEGCSGCFILVFIQQMCVIHSKGGVLQSTVLLTSVSILVVR